MKEQAPRFILQIGSQTLRMPIPIFIAFSLCLTIFAQEISHETIVVNIEVPVRIFDRGKFVDNLTMDDFEVYEDGKPQEVVAVYLIKKTKIERKEEEKKKFSPDVSRHFVLLFQIYDYLPKIEEAIEYFFNNVILPGDSLTIMTPLRTYNLKSQSLENLSKETIVKQLREKIRKDTIMGSAEYKSALRDLEDIVAGRFATGGFETYRMILNRLENLRYVDEKKILNFADFLKAKEGQKYVFLFYQKEVLPQFNTKELLQRISTQQDQIDVIGTIYDLFEFFRRDITFNVDHVKQVFADSSIYIHFLFITKIFFQRLPITSMRPSELVYVDKSEDIYSAFREMAMATGGRTESSANAAFAFKRAVDASESYYLLYYSPLNYKKDSKFKKIRVKVKGKNYRITHRAGYFAD